MSTQSVKTIAVIGATGNQGFSVSKTFEALPHWRVRSITRNPQSAKALELAELGCEVVQADLNDEASLVKAFEGVHAVFSNTDFWGPYATGLKEGKPHDEVCKECYEIEVRHGTNAFRAASQIPTIERFVYSALGPMSRASNGRFTHSYHWETKAAIVDFIFSQHEEEQLSALAEKTSLICVGAFSWNAFLRPQLDPETGKYVVLFPGPDSTKLPIIDPSRSTGPFVQSLLEVEAPGTRLLAYDDDLSLEESFELWSKYTGESYTFKQVSLEEMHEITGKPYEILDGAAYLAEYDYTAGISGVIRPKELKARPKTESYENFVKRQTTEFLLGERGAVQR